MQRSFQNLLPKSVNVFRPKSHIKLHDFLISNMSWIQGMFALCIDLNISRIIQFSRHCCMVMDPVLSRSYIRYIQIHGHHTVSAVPLGFFLPFQSSGNHKSARLLDSLQNWSKWNCWKHFLYPSFLGILKSALSCLSASVQQELIWSGKVRQLSVFTP